MAILEPISIFAQAESLAVDEDGEFWGGAEPYLWAFHWKVDGESLSVRITIDVSGNVQFSKVVTVEPNFTPFVFSPDGSHGNISSDSISDGDEGASDVPIPESTGRFEGNLFPIPITIDFELPTSIENIYWDDLLLEAIDTGISSLGDLFTFLDSHLFDIDLAAIDEIFHNPEVDTCPLDSGGDMESLLEHMSVEFISNEIGGMPGAFGSVFILMEQDLFTESQAESVRRGFHQWLVSTLTNIVEPMSLTNLIPNPDPCRDAIESDAILTFGKLMLAPLFEDVVKVISGTGTGPTRPYECDVLPCHPGPFDALETRINEIRNAISVVDPDDILLIHNEQFTHDDFLAFQDGIHTFPGENNQNQSIVEPFNGSWTLRGSFGLQ